MKCYRDLSKKNKMIKNINSKMTTNSQLSTTEPKKNKNKNEISKQLYTDRITEMEITWRVISGEGEGRMGFMFRE